MSDVPLDPGNGGQSILTSALAKADILLSTTDQWGSAAIKALTGGGAASHARIYVGTGVTGNPGVIEAVPGFGVRYADLDDSMAGDSVVAAFRHPTIQGSQADAVCEFATGELGKPYDYFGAVLDGIFEFLGLPVHVNFGTGNARFFCSQLVIAAFEAAAAPLTLTSPNWQSPDQIATLNWFDGVRYVGHLKFVP